MISSNQNQNDILFKMIMNIYTHYNKKRLNSLDSAISLETSLYRKIISEVRELFKNEPNILTINSDLDKRDIVIVGDIHGSLESLLRIFNSTGLPPEKRYVFLGDLIDRGKNSCEAILLLFLLKCLHKDDVYIIRGNHEFRDMAEHYGFKEECIKRIKDPHNGKKYYTGIEFFNEITDIFKYLPMGAIIDDKKLCVHGGITALVKNRKELLNLKKVGDYYTSNDSAQVEVFWNDPDNSILTYEKSPRGLGCIFGEQAFYDFLINMDLDMVIRGHQNEQQGYNWTFGENGGCLTLFSAIDYCGTTNGGGILIIHNDENQELEIRTFEMNFIKIPIPPPGMIVEKQKILMEIEEIQPNLIFDSIPRYVDF